MNLTAVVAAVLAVLAGGKHCWAWAATSHEWVSGIAIEKLPDSMPEFIRTPEVAPEIAVRDRELDRSKGAREDARCRARFWPLHRPFRQRRCHGCPAARRLPDTGEAYDT